MTIKWKSNFSLRDVIEFSWTGRRNRFRPFLSGNSSRDHFSNSPQRFYTLWYIRAEYLENMIHACPAFQDKLGSLTAGAVGEGLNAVEQNLAAPSLNVDRAKTSQVSPQRRYQ